MSRILVTAMQSGSGKTAVTCGLLAAFQARGLQPRAFKCGPDYIDPMFHARVLGIPSRNLDIFLQGETGVRRTLAIHEGALSLIEGAMGYYDGVGGTGCASAWHLAAATHTPALLVVRPKGASLTLAAQVCGILRFRQENPLAGILLNDCKPSLYHHLAPILERETGLPVVGYLPPMEEARLESRHLGLLTAKEVADFSVRFSAIAAQLERTADLKQILHIASTAPALETSPKPSAPAPCCKIAVAMDEAFCFYYEENLEALRAGGAELCFFSPLTDQALPSGIGGLYLGGGYPELHAKRLGENAAMREAVREAVTAGLPTVAECGGFLYLQSALEDEAGEDYPMTGVLLGKGFQTGRLQRFGYLTLTGGKDSLLLRAGEQLPAHEFHYWDATENGCSFAAEKPVGGKSWRCGFASNTLYAAFPHLHFGGELPLAERFVKAAEGYGAKEDRNGQAGILD